MFSLFDEMVEKSIVLQVLDGWITNKNINTTVMENKVSLDVFIIRGGGQDDRYNEGYHMRVGQSI